MRHENLIVLIGNVGTKPELTQHGDTKITKFSLATTRKWKEKSGDLKEKTTWHQIVCFGKNAEYANEYISKGAQCFIKGEQDNYVFDKDDGSKGYGAQVIANTLSADKYEKKVVNQSTPVSNTPEFPEITQNA